MPIADVFTPDAFSLISLSAAIMKAPYKPRRLGELGIFEDQPISTLAAFFDEKQGVLELIDSTPRGASGQQQKTETRTARSISVPHFQNEDTVLADAVQGVRVFGTESEAETPARVVADKLQRMRVAHELTHEYLRIGAIKGVVLDGDMATTITNLYTFFDIAAPAAVDFLLGTDTTDVGKVCLDVVRTGEAALGDQMVSGWVGLAGSEWFDKFTGHPKVEWAFKDFESNRFARDDMRKGFPFKGITFEEYRGSVAGVDFIAKGDVRFFPVGAPGLYKQVIAPADYMSAVNTLGQLIYANQEPLPMDKGIKLEAQSNVLPVCLRPGCLIRGTSSN